MARETLKDFLRSGAYPRPNENPDGVIQYTLESLVGPDGGPDSSGLAFEFNTGVPLVGFDAADPDAGLIGNFLHYTTQRSGNFYEFNKGNQETYAGNRGQPLQDQDKFLADKPFVPQGTIEDSLMEQYSNSGYFNDPVLSGDELEELIIDKVTGDSPPSAPLTNRNSNELLNGIEDSSDYLVGHTVRALKRNSRFNMDNEFLIDELPKVSQLDQKENYQFVRDDENFYTNFDKIKDAAASLLIKASGYDISEFPKNKENFIKNIEQKMLETDEAIVELYENAVNSPSAVEGEDTPRLTAESLRGRNATGVPNISGVGTNSVRAGKGSVGGEQPSFGNSYNHVVRFGDITQTHKIKTALRMISLFTLLKSLYGEIIEELSKEDKKEIAGEIKKIASSPNTVNAGAQILGMSRKSKKFIMHNYLFNNFLTPTDFSYEACFYRGIKVVFGSKNPSSAIDSSNHMHSIYDSPGFWLAMSNVAIKKTFLFSDTIKRLSEVSTSGSGTKDAIKDLFGGLESVAKIANVFAMIGEKSLHHTNGLDSENLKVNKKIKNARSVDKLDNIPGNRVGKSRRKNSDDGGGFFGGEIGSETTLAWEQSAVPSAYLLPLNIIRAASDLNNSYTRVNPARGMLGSRLVKNTYMGLDTDGTAARIPERVVKIIEDRLDAEYVPFYIQDLRTNEIISFHAFLDTLTDTITPNFTSTPGYGRLDPVQTYQSTTRSLQVGFTVYSTNREDFDDMWYKINKFVTLLYPQWTQGTIVESGDDSHSNSDATKHSRFVQPFTQKIGASPIVRLRVGDVIKSNYSRFALARTFGIGDQGVKANPVGYSSANLMMGLLGNTVFRSFRDVGLTIFATVFGSPQGLLQIASDKINAEVSDPIGGAAANAGLDLAANGLAEILINGFANPLLTVQTLNRLRDPNVFKGKGFAGLGSSIMFVYLNPNMIDGYHSTDGDRFFTSKRLLAIVEDTVNDEKGDIAYKVKVVDQSEKEIADKILHVKHTDIWNDPSESFSKSVAGILYAVLGLDAVGVTDSLAGILSKRNGSISFVGDLLASAAALFLENPESAFMRPEVNPYVRSFHSTRGRGLAGVIKGVTFNWLEDFPWETDHNARAPIGCKINFNFDVIHDIPPGMDHTGYNRAPLYNVGEVMRNVAGDVYDDRFSNSERHFRKGGSVLSNQGSTAKSRGDK